MMWISSLNWNNEIGLLPFIQTHNQLSLCTINKRELEEIQVLA